MSGTASTALVANAELSASFLPLALVLCAVTISLLLLRRRVRQSVDPRESGQQMLERFRRQARVADSLDGMAIQLEELARRVSAQVDTRFAKLEAVIRDADERIARLEALLAATNGKQPPPAVTEHNAEQPAPAAKPRRRGRSKARERDPDTIAAISPMHRQVLELRQQGRGADEIARALGLPLGEVEVILNLADADR